MIIPPSIQLSDGNQVPQIGLGTWPMDDNEIADVVPQAVEAGWRLFDTAVNYRNEAGVGEGIRRSGLPRQELLVTTKVPGRDHGYESTKRSLDESLKRMKLEYVDLYLIHWPNPGQGQYVDTWRAMIDLQKEGKARSIGVSNFKPAHLDRLAEETGVLPALNQIQLYPAVTQTETIEYSRAHNIAVESWSPLGQGANAAFYGGSRSLLDMPPIQKAADAHGRSTGQIILRWHVQQGLIPIPKTSNAKRLQQNIDIFSWSLTNEEMAAISALDNGLAVVADSDEHEES